MTVPSLPRRNFAFSSPKSFPCNLRPNGHHSNEPHGNDEILAKDKGKPIFSEEETKTSFRS